MRKYFCLLFFLLSEMLVMPIAGSAQLKIYQTQLPALDSVLQHTTGKNERLQILQAMVDDVLTFGASNLFKDANKRFWEKNLPEFLVLQKAMGSKALPMYELWQAYRAYSVSREPDARHSLELLTKLIDEFDKLGKSAPNLIATVRIYFAQLNEQEARLAFYEKKVNEYTINGQKHNLAAALFGLAGYYNTKGAHNRAISYYQRSADIYKDFNTALYINHLGVIGSVYASWGNPAKAISFIDSAIFATKVKSTVFPEYQAAYVALKLKDYKRALLYCRSVLQDDLSKEHIAIIKIRMAICEANLGNIAEAQLLIQQGVRIADSIKMSINSPFGELEVDFAKYLCARNLHQYPEALKHLNLALQKFSELKAVDIKKKYLAELLDFYTVTRSYDRYFVISKRLDSLNNDIDSSLAPLKISSYETEQKESRQTDSLNVLKEEKAVQLAVLNKNKALLWASLAGILLISIALYFVYRQSQINKKTLKHLRNTQAQLVQSEKMASLGELTAGIAHEIQNPLNFVNNFSELNKELLAELNEEITKCNYEDVKAIAKDVSENEEKINHHGKRADAIVKGMLLHSRSSNGVKEPTDINALADEYLRLAYHGLRAKDKSFNAGMIMDYDDSIGMIEVIPQDMGRVVLNLITNAFYAVNEKKKQQPEGYRPTVTITTKRIENQVLITVQDNGNGIPPKLMDKIFQPFFTTKPTGEGTGLGLSMSYDIVTKGHGGELLVETQENEFTRFTIRLPVNK